MKTVVAKITEPSTQHQNEYDRSTADVHGSPNHILPITGGSGSEPMTKKQRREHEQRVNHIGVQGPYVKSRWSHVPITFTEADMQLQDYPHNDAMVISCNIGGFIIHKVLVDNGSAADVLTKRVFNKMDLKVKDCIQLCTRSMASGEEELMPWERWG